jgi:ribosomal protein L11 methyltransferase
MSSDAMSSEDGSSSQWVTLSITVPVEDLDLASGVLWDAGAAGVEERAADDDDDRELRAGLLDGSVAAVISQLRSDWVCSIEPVDADEGLDAWREFAQAWRAGSRLVILPAWLEAPDWCRDGDVVLPIEPGRTFGSGSHATTRMCLAELELLIHEGDAVADIGCGSGVLAIAAVRLGAAHAVGVDTQSEAIAVSFANAEACGVGGHVEFLEGSMELLGDRRFDVVVANIAASVLLALVDPLDAAVAATGALVLSGVLDEQVPELLDLFGSHGFVLASTAAEDDWRALVLRRAN